MAEILWMPESSLVASVDMGDHIFVGVEVREVEQEIEE